MTTSAQSQSTIHETMITHTTSITGYIIERDKRLALIDEVATPLTNKYATLLRTAGILGGEAGQALAAQETVEMTPYECEVLGFNSEILPTVREFFIAMAALGQMRKVLGMENYKIETHCSTDIN